MVKLDYEWLKENFPRLMGEAINNPTDANVANFAYAQRLMLDMSSRFQSKMTDFMMGEKSLDENARRPTAAFALNNFKGEVRQMVHSAIDDINDNTKGLWFFYSSTCQYCVKMVPIMNRFIDTYGVDVLAISMDGGVLPGMEKMQIVFDQNLEVSRKMNVARTPTTMLVLNDNSTEIVAEGMRTLSDLEKRYIRAGRIAKAIDKETYQRTKAVYEMNIYNNENGVLMVDKEQLESDPGFLAEALRTRLEDVNVYGTEVVYPE
jgi:conjugal transfer pilus assembly protein TraF